MSLGVLNNLSAMYAAHNLSNTQNSLSKTLQQLSSGSKINSGSDDAAGLSLVNGLQANATALAQSQTNAQEGVGLLQVADGALSQVTNLLNRAVTLATEVSNGTLNSSQQSAANQEYQSILSEVNNIGSTTTFNQQQVFNTNTQIYTGDSSTTGASIDQLNIRSLSSSNLGDTGGTMAYSASGTNGNVFMDLKGGSDAQLTDTLTAATSSIVVNTLSATGAIVANTISVGANTGYANTVQGLISAINNSGLGVTASFTTDKIAGSGATGDHGIMIQGAVGVGANPTSASYSGVAGATGSAAADILSGSITLQVGTNAATTVTAAQVAAANAVPPSGVTMTMFANYISGNTGLGITATAGGGGLTLNSTNNSSGLKVTSNLVDNSLAAGPTALAYTATAGYSAGLQNTNVKDATSTEAANGTWSAGTMTSGGVATISYTDKAGVSLQNTDLSNTNDAQSALTLLNSAIANVAAQDGYIGAQINTLNAVSSVMSTQQQNIVAAQNAVQATDYATASSNMSKFQILSQTGISALAQANSMQQEVLKLLQ